MKNRTKKFCGPATPILKNTNIPVSPYGKPFRLTSPKCPV